MIALYSIYSTTTQELIINQQGCQLLSVSVLVKGLPLELFTVVALSAMIGPE